MSLAITQGKEDLAMKSASFTRFDLLLALFAAVLFSFGCGQAMDNSADNPFLDDFSDEGKEDTGWITVVDAPEVEITLEGDIKTPGRWQAQMGPTDQSQFALTYLRKHYNLYMESQFVVPDHKRKIQWLIDDEWVDAEQVSTSVPFDKLNHYRITGVNAIMYKPKNDAAAVGKVYDAIVPLYPYFILTNHGGTCATNTTHAIWDDDYWYFWDPERSSCTLEKATVTATITKKIDTVEDRYPEYDKLVEDGKVTAVVFFGRFDSGVPIEKDKGYHSMQTFKHQLESAGFEEGSSPDGLIRYTQMRGDLELIVDIASPAQFSGLDDFDNAGVFDQAVKTHEIVVYNGHSILGTSNFWARDGIYPDYYQLFFFNGCLGYEYYVGAIMDGKGSWDKVDVISNIKETPSSPAPKVIAAFLASVFQGAETGGQITYNQVLTAMNKRTFNSCYGISGARNNCFSPNGSLCEEAEPEIKTYSSGHTMDIPDNDAAGITSTIEVDDSVSIAQVKVHAKIEHSWLGDLVITLEHEGTVVALWTDIDNYYGTTFNEEISLDDFDGMQSDGDWNLKLVDTAESDTGTLQQWSLTVVPEK